MDEAARLWRAAKRRLQPEIDSLLRKIERAQAAGQPLGKSWLWRVGRLRELLSDIERIVLEYERSLEPLTAVAQREALRTGLVDARNLVRASVGQDFGGIPPALGDKIIGFTAKGAPLMEFFEEIAKDVAEAAKEVFFAGVIAGDSPRVIGDKLSDTLEISKTRGQLIARTEANRVRRQAHQAFYDANSDVVTGWRWQCAFNGRTCPACLARDGQIFKTGQMMESHPNCRCAMVPLTRFSITPETGEEWFARQPDEVKAKIFGGGSKNGGRTHLALYKSGKITLKDFIEQTSHPRWGPGMRQRSLVEMTRRKIITTDDLTKARAEALQARIPSSKVVKPKAAPRPPVPAPTQPPLPEAIVARVNLRKTTNLKGTESLQEFENIASQQAYESGAIYSAKGELLSMKDGAKSYIQWDAEDIKLVKGSIMTHNHPNGSSFSPDDIRFLVYHQLLEIRAVSKDYDYSLSGLTPYESGAEVKGQLIFNAWNIEHRKEFEAFRARYLAGEDENKVWQEHSHKIMEAVAAKFGLKYVRTKK